MWVLVRFVRFEFGSIPISTYDAPPDPLVGWGGGHPLPIPFPLDAFGISIWSPTSLKFVHLAHRSKRLDTPDVA